MTLATFELRHHIGQVVLQFGISGELKAHVIVGDPGERLWRIDAPLVEDAVDAKCCGGERECSEYLVTISHTQSQVKVD